MPPLHVRQRVYIDPDRMPLLYQLQLDEALHPYVPPEPAFRLFPVDAVEELRSLAADKAAERAAVASTSDQIEQRRFARELERRFQSHGPVARLASSAPPPSGVVGRTGPLARALARSRSAPVEQTSLGLSLPDPQAPVIHRSRPS